MYASIISITQYFHIKFPNSDLKFVQLYLQQFYSFSYCSIFSKHTQIDVIIVYTLN